MGGLQQLQLLATTTAAMLARVVALASALLMAVWLLYLGTKRYVDDEPWKVFPPDYGCDSRLVMDSCTAQSLAYMWLAPLLLAFASLALLWLRARLNAGDEHHRTGTLGRLSQRLLPPKRFWLWWCGGLSVSDALAVAFWAAFNASWAVAVLTRFFSLIPFFSKISPRPGISLELQLVAVACGVFLLPNFVLLFYPVTRGSVVLAAAGLSYPDAIRYHRWQGHAVMVLATAHSLGFWGIWLAQGSFVKEAFDQGAVFNNLAGGVSFLGGLALWLSSLEVARRSSYEVFYKLHHIGFWIFMFAGCCHYSDMFWYFLPGLVLYGVDGVYRLHQGLGFWGASSSGSRSSVRVLAAVASPGGTTCSLTLAAPTFGVAASGFVWLNVPELSWHSWHPFEYFAVPAGDSCGETAMLLHIKSYERWTQRLVALVAAKGVKFSVKIEGPYGELPGAVLSSSDTPHPHQRGAEQDSASGKAAAAAGHHGGPAGMDGLVIAAGGVGATAAMSVLQELATSGEAVRGLPALLVWCCRKADELEFLAPRLLAMAHALGLNLTVKLFCTGDPAATSGAALSAAGKPAAAPAPAGPVATGISGISSRGISSGGGGLTTTSMCPVVGLRSFNCQSAHKLLLHALAFAGTLAAILAVRYASEVVPATAGQQPWPTAAKGASLVVLITAAIVLPGSLALWAALAVQHWQQRTKPAVATGAAAASASGSGGLKLKPPGADGRKKELSRHLLSELSPAGTPTAAAVAAAAAASPLAAGGDAASAVAAAAAAATGFATVQPSGSNSAGWELVLPPGSGASGDDDTAPHPDATCAASYAVECGRPPLQPLLSGWLATLKQLPAASPDGAGPSTAAPRLQVAVYGMGPARLVEDTKLLCDATNAQKAGTDGSVWLSFVQKTHEL